jgi:CRISPR-associated protein Cas2
MMILILERVPRSLRGELTRWLVEVDTGVFVGKVSAAVRELLWQKCLQKRGEGRCCMVYNTNNEQGFAIRMEGYPDRSVRDFDGLQLVVFNNAESLRKAREIARHRTLTSE